MVKYFVSLLSLTTICPGFPPAQLPPGGQDATAEKEILAIETLKNEAMQKGDSKVLGQIYYEKLLFVNAKGKLLTKLDRVGEFASGDVRYAYFRQGDYQVRVYGDTAIVTGVSCSVVEHHGKTNHIPRRFTSVYVRLEDHWRFVAHQATLMSEEESRTPGVCRGTTIK